MEDSTLRVTKTPAVADLATEFTACTTQDTGWAVVDSDNARFCRWPGQSPSGKKRDLPGREAFPWDGASDARTFMCDGIVNELAGIQITAFYRALLRPKAASTETGAYTAALVDYLLNTLLATELWEEVCLSAQYSQHYGWMILHPCWEQELSMRYVKVTLREILEVAQRMAQTQPEAPLARLPELIVDPTTEAEAADLIMAVYAEYARSQASAMMDVKVPELRRARALQVVRDLRRDQEAEVPVPYVCKNQPAIYALRPYEEVFLPADTTRLQDARYVFQREWVTEVELRSRIATAGYNKAWVELAVGQKGNLSSVGHSTVQGSPPTSLHRTAGPAGTVTEPHQLIEVVHAFYRALDDDQVPVIYCTTFHPTATRGKDGEPAWASHEPVKFLHGKLPYVGGRREVLSRKLTDSRGVPEISATWQNEEKALHDGAVDYLSISVLPPLNVYKTPGMSVKYRLGPAVQNTVVAGREPQFPQMPPATGAAASLQMIEQVERKRDNYFGLLSEKVPPARVQTRQELDVRNFLITWTAAIEQMLELAQEYLPDEKFAEVTGAPKGWLDARRNALGLFGATLEFDVRDLDQELTLKRIEAVNQTVLPTDVTGRFNRAKWPEIQLRAINPQWTKELLLPEQAASQATYDKVQSDLALMFLGNEPQYPENDPTAPAKLQHARQIIGANPNYQAAMQQQGRFAELATNYLKSLNFSVQQEENKQVGRIGVKPEVRQ